MDEKETLIFDATPMRWEDTAQGQYENLVVRPEIEREQRIAQEDNERHAD